MKKITSKLSLLLALVMFLGFIGDSNIIPVSAATNYVTATRTITPAIIYPDQEAEVALDIKGTPPVSVVKPNDIIMILDKSGSMATENRFTAMKDSAKEFIDLIDFTKHQVGVVDFSTTSLIGSKDLTTDATSLKDYIGKIVCNGETQTGAAIRVAMDKLKAGRSEAQPVILLLTDGDATNKPDALAAAQEAKDAGIVFYTIALLGQNANPDTDAANLLMQKMATTAQHHHFVLGSVGLIDIYRAIVKEIGIASAYNVTITENVSPEFEIVPDSYKDNIPVPTVSGNTLTWNLLELKDQTLPLKYKVRVKSGTKFGTYNVSSGSTIKYLDYAGASHSYTMPNGTLQVKEYPPTIVSIDPASAQIAGGNTVTIKGDNFRTGATVKFNTTLAKNVVVVDKNTITATVPAGVQGNATVTVTNNDTAKATIGFYYYATPEVTSITPNSGIFAGNNLVKVYGKNFMSDIKAYLGDQEASVKYYNNGYIMLTTPKAVKAGAVDVKLVNGDGTSVIVTNGFTYDPEIVIKPTITSLTPASGLEAGGDLVTIIGTNFVSGITATIGGVPATVTTYSGSTKIIVKVPVGTIGKADVTLTNPDTQSVALVGGYEYVKPAALPVPVITSLTPASGLVAGGDSVTITGTNFVNGITATIGGVPATVATYSGSTKIIVNVPAGTLGKADVTVTNPDTQSGTLVGGYEYVKPAALPVPVITSLTPASGLVAGGDLVTITGSDFVSGITATIGGVSATVATYYGSTKITVNVPAGTLGKADVIVTNPDTQSGTLVGGYEYVKPAVLPAPVITSLTPTSGYQAGGDLVTITGNNFVSGITATIGGQPATVATYYNSTSIRIRVPVGTIVGKADVTVTNPDGQSVTLTSGYEYIKNLLGPAPIITSLNVTSGLVAGGNLVIIEGSNFASGITATIGGITAKVSTYYDTTKIRITVPAGTLGKADVTLTNPDGQSVTLAGGYEYVKPAALPAPVITSLTPASGLVAGGDLVIIDGSDFVSGITATVGGTTATVATYYGSTKIRIRVPAGTLGKADVTLKNPDEQSVTLVGGYEYVKPAALPAPEITSLTPASGLVAGGDLVIIDGGNFVSGITATVGGITAKVATYYGSTKIRITVPVGTLGKADVTLINPDGQSVTSVGGYEYINALPPQITSLNITSGLVTGGDLVIIDGSNFISGITATIGGVTAKVSTYYSSTKIRITVPAGTLGNADVTLTNPDGQSVTLTGGYEYVKAPTAPAPVITTLASNSALTLPITQIAKGAYIYIGGTGFQAKDYSYVNVYDSNDVFVKKLSITTYYNATLLRMLIPSTMTSGQYKISIMNTNEGFESNKVDLTVI